MLCCHLWGFEKYTGYVEIKCQLDATDYFYCRSYCLLSMFRARLCPSSGAREYIQVAAACGIWCFGFQVVGMVCPVCCSQTGHTIQTNHLLHPVGILFPRINDDARSKSHQIYRKDKLEYINEKKCASCWSFSRICITMHGAENVKFHKYVMFVINTKYLGSTNRHPALLFEK
jgi:hypothetical protein